MAALPGGNDYPSSFNDHLNHKPSQHLYVGNLSPLVEEHELLGLFSQCGNIESIGFLKRGKYGFISYTSVQDAIRAVNKLNNFMLQGLPLDVQYKTGKPPAAFGNVPVKPDIGFPNGLKNSEFKWELPFEHSSQNVSNSTMIMDGAKRMRLDAIVENLRSRRLHFPSLDKPVEIDRTKDYKWKGTIAKGGIPVCSARCFSYERRTLDVMLPEYLNFTSKLDLKILEDHPNQVAANAGVLCFEPASEGDKANYYKFMDYLEKKRKAAVAKLNEDNHLIIIPPSEISDTVLKAPRRLRIIGFINRSKQPTSTKIADSEVVRTHKGPSELQREMPAHLKPVNKGNVTEREAIYLATLNFAAELIQICQEGKSD
ncbi:unnamed protein product [Rhodiola kirilowii]